MDIHELDKNTKDLPVLVGFLLLILLIPLGFLFLMTNLDNGSQGLEQKDEAATTEATTGDDNNFAEGEATTEGEVTVEASTEATVEGEATTEDEVTAEASTEATVEGETTTEATVEGEVTTEATSEEPTVEATVEATTEPTVEPTIEPTLEPTVEPTLEPTAIFG
jgi:hypothetical protein